MTVRELWALTTYVGNVQIEDEEHYLSNPLVRLNRKEASDFMFGDNELVNREVKYFDFLFDTMRIVLKEEEKKENENN